MKGTPVGQVYGGRECRIQIRFIPFARARVLRAAATHTARVSTAAWSARVCEQMADTGLFVPAATGRHCCFLHTYLRHIPLNVCAATEVATCTFYSLSYTLFHSSFSASRHVVHYHNMIYRVIKISRSGSSLLCIYILQY